MGYNAFVLTHRIGSVGASRNAILSALERITSFAADGRRESTDQAALSARVQERTGRCDIPDIIQPDINPRLPVISAVKFGDPFVRTAVTEIWAPWPLRVPENTTES